MFRPGVGDPFAPNRTLRPAGREADEALVTRTRAGDRDACDELTRRYRPLALAQARKLYLPSRDRGKLEGEGMLGLVKAIRDYREGRGVPFSAFASLCVGRQVYTALRLEQADVRSANNGATPLDFVRADGTALSDVLASPLPGPHERAVMREDLAAAAEMVRGMSTLEAECFVMQLSGHDYDEIAAALGVTVKSVDNALQRARRRAEQFGVGRVVTDKAGHPVRREPGRPTLPEGYVPPPQDSRRPAECGTISSVPTVEEIPMSEEREQRPPEQAETWAARIEREARERVESIDSEIAGLETEIGDLKARIDSLQNDSRAARAVLATLAAQADSETVERVADVIAGQSTVEEQIEEAEAEAEEAPEPEPEPEPETPERVVAPEESDLTRVPLLLKLGGPLTTKQLREEGVEDVRAVIDALAEQGTVLWDAAVRGADGFPLVRLPDQPLPDGTASQPTDAERAARRLAADPRHRARVEALTEFAEAAGIFTSKRAALAVFGENATDSERASTSSLLAGLAEAGAVERHGPARGKGVFWTHKDYAGAVELALAEESQAPEAAAESDQVPLDEVVMPGDTESVRRDQRRVFDALRARENAVTGELVDATGLPHARVKAYLVDLSEAGVILRTGRNRRAAGQDAGRGGTEYAARPEHRPTEEESAAPPLVEEFSDDAAPRLEEVRDAVRDAHGEVTLGSLALRNEWDLTTVEQRMRELEAKGVVRDVGVDGAPVFVYEKPDGPGDAATAQKRLGIAGAGPATATEAPVRGRAVDGTGRPQRATRKDVNELIEACRRQGCKAELAANGHWRIETPDGRKVLISNTPRSSRGVENSRTRLRRVGVMV